MKLSYAIDAPRELIVSGEAMGCRMTFLRPKENPGSIKQLINGRWVTCRPSAWLIAHEFLTIAENSNVN
jgi:hypothetical protein